jgi:predicted naringenin-chalcone synthase
MRTQKIFAEITSFETQDPKFVISQEDSLEWLVRAHAKAESVKDSLDLPEVEFTHRMSRLLSRYGVSPLKIGQRFVEISDLLDTNWENHEIYNFGNSKAGTGRVFAYGTDIGKKTEFFLKRSLEVFRNFYPKSQTPPDQIIHVTCTGYASPSAPQRLINENKWFESTEVTHAYHMGCYASMPAIRIAEGLVSSLKDRVDIVHTEMCSLHMNPLDHSPVQLIVQSLFADGHIKYSVVPAGTAKAGYAILNITEQIIADSDEDMSWTPASWGMQMTLSRDVPEKIKLHLKPFLERLLAPTGLSIAAVLKGAIFAVHPGGPKIIDAVQDVLELDPKQVEASNRILLRRGNMSSGTLPHVWKEISDTGVHSGRIIVSLAFGPGLTVFGSVFRTI